MSATLNLRIRELSAVEIKNRIRCDELNNKAVAVKLICIAQCLLYRASLSFYALHAIRSRRQLNTSYRVCAREWERVSERKREIQASYFLNQCDCVYVLFFIYIRAYGFVCGSESGSFTVGCIHLSTLHTNGTCMCFIRTVFFQFTVCRCERKGKQQCSFCVLRSLFFTSAPSQRYTYSAGCV